MCGRDGVEVADDGRAMTFRCPYCFGKGFTAKAKLLTPSDGEIVCGVCGETCRAKESFLFGGFVYLAFFASAIGALWLMFWTGPYFALAIFAVFLLGLFALGRLLAPVWRLDAPYRAGFGIGKFLARVLRGSK